MELSTKILSDITVFMKYAKYIPELQRRETWEEIVTRNKNMHIEKFPKLKDEIEEAYKYVYDKKVLPSMRALQFSGKPIALNNARLFNCSYLPVNHPAAFSEMMFLLLSGCGVGYSVQSHHVEELPEIKKSTKTRRYLIGDSVEGWSDAVKVLVEAYFRGKPIPEFDFGDIRPKGAALVTSGGKAPGPEPLKDCLHNIQKMFDRKEPGDKLTTLEVHDICCYIADAVLAGGIRRSALLSLFSFDDDEMLTAKFGNWWELHPHRARANNSVVLLRHRVKRKDFYQLWEKIKESNAGEPGFFFTNDQEYGLNPCLTGDTMVAVADGRGYVSIKELADLGEDIQVFALDSDGNMRVSKMRRPHLTARAAKVYQIELDNGFTFKATENHKFPMQNGEIKMVKDLVGGESFRIMKKFESFGKTLIQFGNQTEKETKIIMEMGTPATKSFRGPIESIRNRGYTSPETLEAASPQIRDKFYHYLASGYDCFIDEVTGDLRFNKICEYSGEPFVTAFPEVSVKHEYATEHAEKLARAAKHVADITDPTIKTCKVASVKFAGCEDVYNGTVAEHHNFFIGKFETNGNIVSINTMNCAEISLRPNEFCNLTSVNVSDLTEDDQDELISRSRAAAFIGTLQASYTNFHYLRAAWKRTTEKEALIGVSMTGIATGGILSLDVTTAAEAVKEENVRVAELIGINKAARATTVKPEGSSSLVVGSSSGIHAWHNDYYIRRMRVGKNEPIYAYLAQNHAELLEDEFFNPTKQAVISVPVKAPANSVLRTESALDLLSRVEKIWKEWVEPGHRSGNNVNNVSTTVTIKEDEWDAVRDWMWKHRTEYTALSVLPHDDHSYKQAPFEDITEEQYEELFKSLVDVDLTNVIEVDDATALQENLACAGGACEIR